MPSRTRMLLGLRLPRPLLRFSSSSYHLSSTASPCPQPAAVADASAVVDVLLRTFEGDGERKEEDLRALFSSTGFNVLQVIRSLPSTAAALRFFDWCRSQSSIPSAAAIDETSAFQAMFEMAAREEEPHPKLKDLLRRSTQQGCALTPDAAALLVRSFSRAHLLSDALEIFGGLNPSLRTTPLCNDLLRLLFRSTDPSHRGEATAIVRAMIQSGHSRFRPDSATCSIVFSALSRRNQVLDDDAADLGVLMAENGEFPRDVMQFTQLIDKLCCSGRTDKARQFLLAVKKSGGVLEAAPCNALLTGLAKCHDFQGINSMLADMKELGIHPDIITFGILINCLCKSRRIDEALQVLDNLSQSSSSKFKVVPDVITFNMIINGLCKVGRLEEGLALLARMKSEYGCSPNTITYNCLIDGFCKSGDIERGNELLEQMKDEGIIPNVVTLNTLMDGMCRHGRISSAVKLFREVQSATNEDIKGNAITYNILIGAFLHANNVNQAMELFEEMSRSGLAPDAISYFALISGLCQAGRLDQACSVASKMQKDGFHLDTKSYNILIGGFCKKKKLNKAVELLAKMLKVGLKPDQVTFNTLIAASTRNGDFSTAHLLVERMIDSGCKPSVVTYGTLVHGYCKSGNLDDAVKIFRSMAAVGIPPNTVIYNILIDFLSKEKEPISALSLLDEMQNNGISPTTITYNAIFRGLQEMNLLNEAYELMDKMKKQACKPDYITMEILTEWLSAVGDTSRLRSFVESNEIASSSM